MDQGYDDLSLAGGAGALDEDVVAADDVLVAHGVATHLEGEDVAVSDDIVQGNALRDFRGFNGQAGGDSPGQGQPVAGAGAGSGGQHIDGPAAVVYAVQHAFLLKVGNVLVDGCQALQPHSAGDLFEGGRVAVASHEGLEEVENVFLPACYSHGRIIANKQRTATTFFRFLFAGGIVDLQNGSKDGIYA